MELEKRIDLSIRIRKVPIDSGKILYVVAASVLLIAGVASMFVLNADAAHRAGWISSWASQLTSACSGYPCAWNYFFITDGPLLVIFAALGSLYLLARKRFDLLLLVAGGFLIVLTTTFFLGSDSPLLIYILRFYATFSVLMSIPASMLFHRLLSDKNFRRIGLTLLAICIAIQLIKLGYFYSQIQPAITQDEYAAAQYLYQHRTSEILFINNGNEDISFRSFKWVVVYSEAQNYHVNISVPPSLLEFDYIFVDNINKLTQAEKQALSARSTVFSSGDAAIYGA